jgi:hypothetical protein
MNIKQIIRETLILEIGDASAKPYKWKLDKKEEDFFAYTFKTKGSKVTIEVTFHLLAPWQITNLTNSSKTISRSDRNYYDKNDSFYWDTEFSLIQHKGEDIIFSQDPTVTISDSKFKTDKVEIYRIMSTLSEITKDLIKNTKVRGFAFRPANESRGRIFIKYFQKQVPKSKITELESGATIITTDETILSPPPEPKQHKSFRSKLTRR